MFCFFSHSESDGRLEYLEVRPDGYRNPTSLHTHVEVIRDSLNAVITADPEIRRYEKCKYPVPRNILFLLCISVPRHPSPLCPTG